MKFNLSHLFRFTLYLICLGLPACGGGTIGSSPTGLVSKSFNGRVVGVNGEGLANASITVSSSGDSGTTDSNGNFSFEARVVEDSSETITIRSADGRITTITTVYPGPDGNFKFTYELVRTLDIAFNDYLFRTTIDGAGCDNRFYATSDEGDRSFFQNQLARFGQISWFFDEIFAVSPGTTCSFSGQVTKGGQAISLLKYKVETGGCSEEESTTQIGEGVTSAAGTYNALFRFDPKLGSCSYRVVFEGAGLPGIVSITAFSKIAQEGCFGDCRSVGE